MAETKRFFGQAIDLARENVGHSGRPFRAVVVKDGKVIATGVNETAATTDPTAHAELMAVRARVSSFEAQRWMAASSTRADIPAQCASQP